MHLLLSSPASPRTWVWVRGRKKLLGCWGPNICGSLLLSDPTSEKEMVGITQPAQNHLLGPCAPWRKVQETFWFGLVVMEILGFLKPPEDMRTQEKRIKQLSEFQTLLLRLNSREGLFF